MIKSDNCTDKIIMMLDFDLWLKSFQERITLINCYMVLTLFFFLITDILFCGSLNNNYICQKFKIVWKLVLYVWIFFIWWSKLFCLHWKKKKSSLKGDNRLECTESLRGVLSVLAQLVVFVYTKLWFVYLIHLDSREFFCSNLISKKSIFFQTKIAGF